MYEQQYNPQAEKAAQDWISMQDEKREHAYQHARQGTGRQHRPNHSRGNHRGARVQPPQSGALGAEYDHGRVAPMDDQKPVVWSLFRLPQEVTA